MVSAVIFDVDGTLVDSVSLHAEAWRRALSHFGFEVPFERVRAHIGMGSDQLIPTFIPKSELPRVYDALDSYRSELYRREFLPKVQPFPGVRELFLRLQEDGKRIVLASSAKGDELETYKRLTGIEDLIRAETSADAVEKSKPHPDIFEEALRSVGADIPPNHCVVVGDSPFDAIAARRAHLRTVGLLCGGFAPETLWQAGCVQVYADIPELHRRYEAEGDAAVAGGLAALTDGETAPGAEG